VTYSFPYSHALLNHVRIDLDIRELNSVHILKLTLKVPELRSNLVFRKYLPFCPLVKPESLGILTKTFPASVGSKLCCGRDQELFIQALVYCLMKQSAERSKEKKIGGYLRNTFFSFVSTFSISLTQKPVVLTV
jgi:hypothetical protein